MARGHDRHRPGVETDPARMCELLVGLPDVTVLGVVDQSNTPLRLHIETREPRPACAGCGQQAPVKERPTVEVVDLAVFGRQARLVWRKHRGVRLHPLPQLPRPRAALRRQAPLAATRHHHTPLKSEEPVTQRRLMRHGRRASVRLPGRPPRANLSRFSRTPPCSIWPGFGH
jgi:hypothetical protein